MSIVKKAALLVGFLSGCASAPEERALQVWRQEDRQWAPERSERLDPAGLDAYVGYAQRHNPGLRAAFERWKSALEQIAPARSLADPRFTYGYFLREVETRVGSQQQRFGVAQTFPWAGKLDLKGRVALQGAEVERQRYEMARRALVFAVKTAYYDCYYLERAISVTEDNMRLLTYLEEVARAHYRGGMGAHEAVIKVQVELGRLEDRLHSMRLGRRPAMAQLNAALGRSLDTPVVVPDSLVEAGLLLNREELVDLLKAANPALQASAARAARAALAVELAGKDFYPDVTLGVDYIRTGAAQGVAQPADSGKDPLVAMATVNLPLWRGRYRAQQRQAEARHRAALQQRQDEQNQLVARLEQALYNRSDAASRTALYRDGLLPKAEQMLNVAQQAFAAGRGGFLGVIDAQRTLLEFQLAYERGRTDQARHLAEIEKLVGEPLVTEECER